MQPFDDTYARPFRELAELGDSPEEAARLARLRYHLRTGDYFAFLATIFGILEDSLVNGSASPGEQLALVKNMRKDLVYLQQECQIGEQIEA